ncbi:MAG: hypothetical protein GY862_21255 [Gammaproteobacteria bacterium]|nr:hypothetical protein [Gammaproteobacteria bacterium]
MHKSQNYIRASILPGTPSASDIESRVLNGPEAKLLLNHLHNDAAGYLYSATVSLGDAISGIRNNLLTWATVKLYYTTFYALRAFLAFDGVCLFYIGTKPCSIEARSGNVAKKENGSTHKAVMNIFSIHAPSHFLLSQKIDSEQPLSWLINRREEANYRNARFCEPGIPKHFEKIVELGIRNAIQCYMKDSLNLLLFDPEHAILSYPLMVLQCSYIEFRKFDTLNYTEREYKYLRTLLRDQDGPIPEIYRLID